jgi:hypothetical protein
MRIYRFKAKMAELGNSPVPNSLVVNSLMLEGRIAPPSATSATETALGLRPRRALSSVQLPAEWTTTTSLRNDSSLNSFYPLNFVSHHKGAVHKFYQQRL